MEKAIGDAFAEAGHFLAEALEADLIARGLPGAFRMSFAEGRILIDSNADEVHRAERGELSAPPTAPVETAARAATAEMLDNLQRRLREVLR